MHLPLHMHSQLPFVPEWKHSKVPPTTNARDMMQRLENDLSQSAAEMMQGYAANMRMLDSTLIARLRAQIRSARFDKDAIEGIEAAESLSIAVNELDALLSSLGQQRTEDAERVIVGTSRLVELANASSIKRGGVRELLRFQLRRMGGQKAKAHFEYIAAAMISRSCGDHLKRLNPMLNDVAAHHELPKACATILLHTIRLCQVNRAIVTGNQLKKDIEKFLLQLMRTQAAVTLAATLPRESYGPTEEMIRWALQRPSGGFHRPTDALERIQRALADGATLVRSAGIEGRAIALAMQLCRYDVDEARQLLSQDRWVEQAMQLQARGCCIPTHISSKQLALDHLIVSGPGADAGIAVRYASMRAQSSRLTPVLATKAGSTSGMRYACARTNSCAWARVCACAPRARACVNREDGGLSVYARSSMAAMLHAMGATSMTLATELTSRRYYMDSRTEKRVASFSLKDEGKVRPWWCM